MSNGITQPPAAKQRKEVVPNMEWVDGKFIKARPFPQPKVIARVDVMHENMEKHHHDGGEGQVHTMQRAGTG